MRWRQIVACGLALGLLLTGVAAWRSFDRGDQVLAAANRALGYGPARLVRIGGRGLAVVTVDSTATLIAALKSAQGGDTIALAPGVYTGLMTKIPFVYQSTVTITSADPSNLAVITDFTLSGAKNLTFRKVELATLDHSNMIASGSSYWAFKIAKSSDIHFDQVKVHGSLDGNAANDVQGIQIRDSKNVSVTNSEFQQLERGLAIGQTDNVKVFGNHAHHLRSDGFNFAEVGNVEVTSNTLHDFTPTDKDHPDAIQFWTSGTKTPAHDILISGNVIVRGDGAYAQGIFLRDQLGTLPYERLTISDNLIVGTGYSGIRVIGAVNLTVTNNELVSFLGDNKTFFMIQKSDRVTAIGNNAAQISFDKSTNVTQTDNVVTKAVTDSGVAAIKSWIAGNPSGAGLLDRFLPIEFTEAPSLYGVDLGFTNAFGLPVFGFNSDFMFA